MAPYSGYIFLLLSIIAARLKSQICIADVGRPSFDVCPVLSAECDRRNLLITLIVRCASRKIKHSYGSVFLSSWRYSCFDDDDDDGNIINAIFEQLTGIWLFYIVFMSVFSYTSGSRSLDSSCALLYRDQAFDNDSKVFTMLLHILCPRRRLFPAQPAAEALCFHLVRPVVRPDVCPVPTSPRSLGESRWSYSHQAGHCPASWPCTSHDGLRGRVHSCANMDSGESRSRAKIE